MISWGVWIILAYLALAFQTTLFSGSKPDLVLLLVCFYALSHDLTSTIILSSLAGLLTDVASGFIIGPSIISKSLIGYLVIQAKQSIVGWEIIKNTMLILIASILDFFIIEFCLATFSRYYYNEKTGLTFMVDSFYTVLAGIALYYFVNKYYLNRPSNHFK